MRKHWLHIIHHYRAFIRPDFSGIQNSKMRSTAANRLSRRVGTCPMTLRNTASKLKTMFQIFTFLAVKYLEETSSTSTRFPISKDNLQRINYFTQLYSIFSTQSYICQMFPTLSVLYQCLNTTVTPSYISYSERQTAQCTYMASVLFLINFTIQDNRFLCCPSLSEIY